MFPRAAATCILLVAACLLASCKDRAIATYRAPKDPAPTMPMPGAVPASAAPGDAMAATAVPTGSDSLSWTAPAAWTAKAPGAMRKGSFAVKGDGGGEADLSITAFPGDTGGLLANLNRWRGQVSLPPLAESQLDGVLEHLDAGALHFEVVDFVGTAKGVPTRMLGAVLSRPGETWFFKLMGPDALVAARKAEFTTFLRSVKESAK
ncbi:MAG: hypothetical protein WDM96_12000 [Lacunisphaera sp.]